MKKLWNAIDKLKASEAMKNRIFITICVLVPAAVGAIVWLAVGRLIYSGAEGLICFIGCPAIFAGFFGSVLYLFKHEFE